jgi:hypothetical protein
VTVAGLGGRSQRMSRPKGEISNFSDLFEALAGWAECLKGIWQSGAALGKSTSSMNSGLDASAQRELVRTGYQVVETPGEADAKLRFMVVYGLGIASAFDNARGVATTVNMELARASDNKRLVFAITNVVKDPEKRALVRTAPYAQWFSDEALLVNQHRLIAEGLTVQAMAGL